MRGRSSSTDPTREAAPPAPRRGVRRERLLLRYARNDLVKNRGVSLAILALITLSAFMMATGAMVIERTVGSVDALFAEAEPPHFLQMHRGEIDHRALEAFAAEHPEIEAWQVVRLIGFDGAALSWHRPASGERGDLSASLIDQLFTAQNRDFDFLLDETGAIPEPGPGEVYAPVAAQQRFGLWAGDELAVRTDDGGHSLTVRGFVRDAQMASSLSSATRFLVSPADLRALGDGGGAPERIVEYLLTDPADASELQRAYESDEALPRNGQAVTFDMIRIINSVSDGLVAVALVFASLLLIAIAALNLRFVIRGTMQDEVRQIGAMKAIGIPDAQIARLHLSRYRALALAGCLAGGALAIGAAGLLTRGTAANYAAAPAGPWTVLVPALALALVYLFVTLICRRVLRGVRRVDVVSALVHGSTLTEHRAARLAMRQARRARRTSLSGRAGPAGRAGPRTGIGLRLALIDLRAEAREWLLLPAVFALAAVLMTLPANLLGTLESPRFVTYMGAPESALRADLQFSDDVDALRAETLAAFADDERLVGVRAYAKLLAEVEGESGAETMRVEVGDYSGATVDFVRGERPGDGEIALSVLSAEERRAEPGDALRMRIADRWETVTVSGVYQDVTSGGRTAKLQGSVAEGALGYVVYADLAPDTAADEEAEAVAIAAEYRERLPGVDVIPMREYVRQTLEYATSALRGAAVLAFAFGAGTALVITALFLKLRLSRDRRKMGVLSAIGFSAAEIVAQVRGKTLLMAVAGTLLGVAFAATLGESLTGSLIALAGLGLVDFAFEPAVWLAYGAIPLALVGTAYTGAVLLTRRLRRADRSGWLR